MYERIASELARRIASEEYKLGDRLPSERDLASAFAVSRPTIREAVIALELDGLVDVRTGSGVYVKARRPKGGAPAEADVGPFELLEARKLIEPESAALAATHIRHETLLELERLVTEMEDENARDVVMSEDADRRFHMLIAEAGENSAMRSVVALLWEARLRSPQYALLRTKAHAAGIKPRISEHAEILRALRARDPQRARLAMRDHLAGVINQLLEATESEAIEQARAQVAETRKRYASGPH